MLEDFGVAKPGESHVQRLIALSNFLIERRRAGQNTVLILDEAQNLDLHALEQIRLLSNFETPRRSSSRSCLSVSRSSWTSSTGPSCASSSSASDSAAASSL